MRVLYVGELGFVGRAVLDEFRRMGQPAVGIDPRETGFDPLPSRPVDLLVHRAGGPEEVLELAERLRGRIGHYVLISSCEVYPATFRTRPWRVEELELSDPSQTAGALHPGLAARGAEFALRRAGFRAFAWTILRPAWLEGRYDPSSRSSWFVRRILDGGPIILPDGGLPLYRHLHVSDLVGAIRCMSGRSETFGQILNICSQGVLSYWGHAAMIRDGLRRPVEFEYVSAALWRSSGLALPFGEGPSCAFLEPSPLLETLGWRATEELSWVMDLARELGDELPGPEDPQRAIERRVVQQARIERERLLQPIGLERPARPPRQWFLRAAPGRPVSVHLETQEEVQPLPYPILRTRRLAIGESILRLLRGQLPGSAQPRCIGHNALLEQVGGTPLSRGRASAFLTLARRPCVEPDCPFCVTPQPGVFGLDFDGYGSGVVTVPPAHVLEVPLSVQSVALLADPLACALEALEQQPAGPVWISGTAVEALLAAWLVLEAGRPVQLLDSRASDAPSRELAPVLALETARQQVADGRLLAPHLCLDLASDPVLTVGMALATQAGGAVVSTSPLPFALPDAVRGASWPLAARDRTTLSQAVEILERWQKWRPLEALLSRGTPLERYWDALLPTRYALSWLTSEGPGSGE